MVDKPSEMWDPPSHFPHIRESKWEVHPDRLDLDGESGIRVGTDPFWQLSRFGVCVCFGFASALLW